MHSAVIRIRRTMGRDQAAAMLNIFAERCQRLSQAGEWKRESGKRQREAESECKRENLQGLLSLKFSTQLTARVELFVAVAVGSCSSCCCCQQSSLLLLFQLLLLMAARPQFLCFRFLSFLVFCISGISFFLYFRWQLFVLWPMQLAYD